MPHGKLDVVTGRVVSPSIGPTRTEEDFVAHIEQTIQTDAEASWIFIADQLNTHVSAGLGAMVAQEVGKLPSDCFTVISSQDKEPT